MIGAHAYKADGLSESQIRDRLRHLGVPDRAADAAVAREMSARSPKTGMPGVSRAVRAAKVEAENATWPPFSVVRAGDTLEFTICTPPRTSKNSRRGLYRHSVAYARFRAEIIASIKPESDHLGLPMPAREYNMAAVFYVDRRGDRADLFGLLQGLADALQAAGVVSDDWQFRTVNGSSVVLGDDCPRVTLTITPIEG